MENYLTNRFKLNSNEYCRNSTIQKEIAKMQYIREEVNDSTIFHSGLIKELVSLHVEQVENHLVTDSALSSTENAGRPIFRDGVFGAPIPEAGFLTEEEELSKMDLR